MKRAAAAFAAFVLVTGLAGQADAASQRGLELAHRYVAAMDMQKNVAPMLDNMMSALLKQQVDSYQGDAETKAKVVAAMHEAFNETFTGDMLQKLMASMEPAIAETFTEEELLALVDFYESPIGRSVISKTPALGARSSEAMLKVMPGLQADLIKRLQDKLGTIDKKLK